MTIDDSLQTTTSIDQAELERRVAHIYATEYADGDEEGLSLNPQQHIKYLYGGLGQLPSGFISLDASRTWICYWVTHRCRPALLGGPVPQAPDRDSIIAFIASCQHPEGGFGGGPYQLAHLAPTYAATVCLQLACVPPPARAAVVDRPKLLSFLLRMCVPAEQGGGMTMHEAGGEVDVRGCYCALAACEMLLLDKSAVADACGMVDYICRCQSHEGGIGGEPWNEAHGGYTFCGLAAAALLGKAHALDLDRLLRWAVRCQGQVEGGFMGRTNKLVDGCYSFWQGGVFPLLVALLKEQQGAAALEGLPLLYDAAALQLWLLKCCQMPRGGLRDKPGKPADYYHTCYCLSGLSCSQHYSGIVLGGAQVRDGSMGVHRTMHGMLCVSAAWQHAFPVPMQHTFPVPMPSDMPFKTASIFCRISWSGQTPCATWLPRSWRRRRSTLRELPANCEWCQQCWRPGPAVLHSDALLLPSESAVLVVYS
ncbi:hypothetical protein CHLNCDRAFT_28585 [Chlorella variabilis]|uniref:Protein farnesyltransferase subunit beta n=1 Tax=Chlorella variabilis TaxID=554065 RepID=E1ZTF0_CHLVA|nr:hypothetical protein CHLNCDRAFT_28585 [Chlorella variabilis]EFN50919.1 hypothetical protein CHLNCDRAFT_28585 [Chlorella variabilis]|eukprot:XP_005843021.1 hypothetical protein CHLNCDRAFT_28585 [Chlorella variabilis]